MKRYQRLRKATTQQSRLSQTPSPNPLQKKSLSSLGGQQGGQTLEEMQVMRKRFEATGSTFIWGHNAPPESSPQQIQAKLTIGKVGDKYEQEADAVAADVVKKINNPASQSLDSGNNVQRQEMPEEELQMKPILQRNGGVGGGAASEKLEQKIESARGSGQSLDSGLQTKMGDAMGADFSGVKIHTDSQSDQLNRSIQAKAFTTGKDVFFRQGAYAPQSEGGQELIAHELTHVVQQGGAGIQTKPTLQAKTSPPGMSYKKDNKTNLKAIARQPQSSPKISHLAPKTIQREVLLDPGIKADVKNKTPVYKEKAVEDSKNAKKYHLGNLTKKEQGIAQETGQGDWLKFTFEKVVNKFKSGEDIIIKDSVPLHNSKNIEAGFVHKPQVSYRNIGDYGVAGHGKAKKEPLFKLSENDTPIISPDDVKQGNIGDCMLMAALVKLADKEPSLIQNMITDNGDTVSVRFYRNGSPETVTVRKTVLKKTKTSSIFSYKLNTEKGQHRRMGARGLVLWPAMVEKAYAKFAGSYQAISPGSLDPYETITGRKVHKEELFEVFDFRGTQKDLKNKLQGPKFTEDHKKWAEFINKKLGNFLADKNNDPGLSEFENFLIKAGVSSEFKEFVIKEYGDKFDKGIETGDYVDSTLVGFEKIKAILDRGEYIGTGTKDWRGRKKGQGQSGGEDLDKVQGLASPHAYAIIGYVTRQKGNKTIHYLKVRNPWGNTGMKYENGKRVKIDSPEFEIELADARRFFGEKGGWRYTETKTEDLITKAQNYKSKNGNLDKELTNNLNFHKDKLETDKNGKENTLQRETEKLNSTTEEVRVLGEEIKQLQEDINAIAKEQETAPENKQNSLDKKWNRKDDQKRKKMNKLHPLKSSIDDLNQTILKYTTKLQGINKLLSAINELLKPTPTVDTNQEKVKLNSVDSPEENEE